MVLALVVYGLLYVCVGMQVVANQDISRTSHKIYRRVEPRIGESYVLRRRMYFTYVFN